LNTYASGGPHEQPSATSNTKAHDGSALFSIFGIRLNTRHISASASYLVVKEPTPELSTPGPPVSVVRYQGNLVILEMFLLVVKLSLPHKL